MIHWLFFCERVNILEDEKMCLNFDDNRPDCCCCDGYDANCHDYFSESAKPALTEALQKIIKEK